MLRKSQKFVRKISVVEFRYSHTVFLRFTVILFDSNLEEKIVPSNEQRAKTNEQRAKSSASKEQ